MRPADTREIIAYFDGLDAGDVGLFLCTDGTIGAHIDGVSIRAVNVIKGLTGYGANAEEALTALWQAATQLLPHERLLIRRDGERRAVRWNGATWKPAYLEPAPEAIEEPS